jgi:hypothetical protein
MNEVSNKSKNMGFSFSKEDGIHAALAVIPSIILILLGNLSFGIALAIGTLPTSQLGIAPKRKQRIAFSILGCLFGIGIYIGSFVALINSIWMAGLVFFVVAFISAVLAARKPIGAIMLALILPAMTVGFGFSKETALSLTFAFVLGSLWSGFVTLFWPEEDKVANKDGMKAFVADKPKQYGVLLGLAAATAIFYGYFISPEFIAWTATAAMLIMRPLYGMVKTRGFWRAVATVIGGILAIITITMQLPNIITAALVLIVMVIIIGTSKSGWWLMPLGTAFFILTLSLLGETDSTDIKIAGWERITDNVVGAGIALFYGLLVPLILKRHSERKIKN